MMLRWRRYFRTTCGFTLTELIVTMATSSMLLGTAVTLFYNQQTIYLQQEQSADLTLTIRAALDIITRDLRMAGYGVPTTDLEHWIDWLRDADDNPIRFTEPINILPGETTSTSDTLMLIGGFDAPIAWLRNDTAVGTTRLNLLYDSRGQTFTSAQRKLFYLGRNENGLVTQTPNVSRRHSRIDIDTDPTTAGNQGTAWRYSGRETPLELIKVITYSIHIDTVNYNTPTPVLKRNENTGGYAQPLAEYIETLKVTRNGNRITVTLTGRVAKSDPNYTDPTFGDGYRRLALTSRVTPRGLRSP